jgi:hypothetical protein
MTMHATTSANQQQPANPAFTHQPSRTPVRLSPQQYAHLTSPLLPERISQDPRGFNHVEAYDIEAKLTEVFGFGMWSKEVLAEECISEDFVKGDNGGGKWWVSWRVRVRLTAYDPHGNALGPFEDGTIETGSMPQKGGAHELAYKAAISGALKRCARSLGNQYGLSLYRKPPKDGSIRGYVSVLDTTLNPPTAPGHGVEQAPPYADGPTIVEEVAALRREAADAGLEPEDVEDAMLQAYGHALEHASADEVARMRTVIREGMAA